MLHGWKTGSRFLIPTRSCAKFTKDLQEFDFCKGKKEQGSPSCFLKQSAFTPSIPLKCLFIFCQFSTAPCKIISGGYQFCHLVPPELVRGQSQRHIYLHTSYRLSPGRGGFQCYKMRFSWKSPLLLSAHLIHLQSPAWKAPKQSVSNCQSQRVELPADQVSPFAGFPWSHDM